MAVKQLVHPARIYAWLTANATSATLTVSTADAQMLEAYRQALGGTLHLLVGTWVTRDMYDAQGSGAYKYEIVEVSSIDTNTGVITTASAMTDYASYTTANNAFVSTNLVYDGAMQMWGAYGWGKTGQTVDSFEFAKVYYDGEFMKGPLRLRFGNGGEVYRDLSLPAGTNWALVADAIGKSGFSPSITAKLLTIANVNDVFVYDTRRDTEPDTWRADTSYSWHTSYGDFPVVAVLVAADSSLVILDAADGSTWATFQQGSGYALGSDTNNDPTCVFALNGKVWVGMTGTAAEGLFELDFTLDKAYKYDTAGRKEWSGNLGSPNTSGTWGSNVSGLQIVSATVNDVYAKIYDGRLQVFVATTGDGTYWVTSIRPDAGISVDFGPDLGSATSVRLGRAGTAFIGSASGQAQLFEGASQATTDVGSATATFSPTSAPALPPGATTVNCVEVAM